MRQQLDELDALLQRMLTLPVSPPDDATADAHASIRPSTSDPSPTPLPGRGPRLVLLDGSAPVQPPSTPPSAWDPHWNINLNPQEGSSILGRHSPAASVHRGQSNVPPPVFRAETVAFAPAKPVTALQPAAAALTPVTQTRPEGAQSELPARPPLAEPTPVPLMPVVALNRMFDAIMLSFGRPGEWFCTSAGRNLLGYAGLALLACSVVWGAAGWFRLPR
jgi:hypothetical protein